LSHWTSPAKWIGNAQPIALKHDLQVTDDHFEKAVRNPVQLTAKASRTIPNWPA